MHWLDDFETATDRNAPLAQLTWFGLGGAARYLVHPESSEDLGRLLERALAAGVPIKVLGDGANVLIRDDGFDGVVIRLDRGRFQDVRIDGTKVRAGGGADLMKLVRQCCRQGLAGLESLAGVPGSVGGAIRMNAGGKYGQIADVVETVEVVDPDGCRRVLPRDQVGFGYRCARLGSSVVVGATFALWQEEPKKVYQRYRNVWAEKHRVQPLKVRSAGCTFKNPAGDSAGRLIDSAGFKGVRHGGAVVSSRHANFIEAQDGATAADVLWLIDQIRNQVRRQFNTELELEIDVW